MLYRLADGEKKAENDLKLNSYCIGRGLKALFAQSWSIFSFWNNVLVVNLACGWSPNYLSAHWPFLDQKSEKSFCEEDHAALVNQESEQSDDELLTLSSPHGNANGDRPHGAKKPSKEQEPAAPPPPEEVDLLGLEGSDVSGNFSPLAAPPSNSELLSDLFGGGGATGPAQAGQAAVEDVFHPSGPASAQSTPRRATTSASASPTLRVGEGNFPVFLCHPGLRE